MLTSISQADTGAIEVPSREATNRRHSQRCFDIGIGAKTIITLAEHALESFDVENHQGHDLAHSVDLIARDIERRAELIGSNSQYDGGLCGGAAH